VTFTMAAALMISLTVTFTMAAALMISLTVTFTMAAALMTSLTVTFTMAAALMLLFPVRDSLHCLQSINRRGIHDSRARNHSFQADTRPGKSGTAQSGGKKWLNGAGGIFFSVVESIIF